MSGKHYSLDSRMDLVQGAATVNGDSAKDSTSLAPMRESSIEAANCIEEASYLLDAGNSPRV